MLKKFLLLSFGIFACVSSYAAPMMQMPTEINATVRNVQFYEEEFIKGQENFSGSMSVDRTIRAHYRIDVDSDVSLGPMSAIWLFADQKDEVKNKVLQKIMKGDKIKVTGYRVRGDEGGLFEAYCESIEILN